MGRNRTGSTFRRPLGIRRGAATGLAVATFLALAAPARADNPTVGLRVGAHPDHVRLVFDCPRPMDYEVEQQGQRVLLRLSQPAAFRLAAASRGGLRNIGAVQEEAGGVAIEVHPGTRLQHFRLGNRIVLDIYDARGPVASRQAPPRRPETRAAAAPAADAIPVDDPSPAPAATQGLEAPPSAPPLRPARLDLRPVAEGPARDPHRDPAPRQVSARVEQPIDPGAETRGAASAEPGRTGDAPAVPLVRVRAERPQRPSEPLPEQPVSVGRMMIATGTRMVIAAGTWSMPGGDLARPVNRARIACSRDTETCVEAVASLDLRAARGGSLLSSDLHQYRIVTWTAEEILAERNLSCVTQVLVLRLRDQSISLADRPHPTPLCRFDSMIAAGIWTLGDGAEPIARFFASRPAAEQPDLRADSRAAPAPVP